MTLTPLLDTEGKERPEKEADHPDWRIAGLRSKGTYLRGLSWTRRDETPQRCWHPNLYTDALTGSATFWSLGAAPLRIPAVRESHRDLRATHHAREGVGSWGLPGFSRRVSEKSGPLNDLP